MIAKYSREISYWLFLTVAMVMVMAIIGAITRLTESGLSIAEWRPIVGTLPPMNHADWMHLFDVYKTSPQYLLVNRGMSLAEFKNIFWWEWVHREWGRLIGLVYAAGLVWFWIRKKIPGGYKLPLLGILALGCAQGVLGWWMVASGLVHEPAVSHYRLAAHLLLAVALYVACLWTALSLRADQQISRSADQQFFPLYKHSIAALGMVIVTLIWGAFTAGLRAGLIYNTWPLMNGHFAPPDLLFLHPWWRNFFENPSAVQFTHRCLAYITSLMCISIGILTYVRRVPPAAQWGYAVGAMGFIQPALGIATLLTQVDLHPAVTHQAGAFVLIGLLVVWIVKLKALPLIKRPTS